MASSISERTNKILEVLGQEQRDEIGQAWLSGKALQEKTHFSPAEINDAINLLYRCKAHDEDHCKND